MLRRHRRHRINPFPVMRVAVRPMVVERAWAVNGVVAAVNSKSNVCDYQVRLMANIYVAPTAARLRVSKSLLRIQGFY
jgi:hypothetical protein